MSINQKILSFFARYSIRRETALFRTTGNPIHAWRAYKWARLGKQPIPIWILQYFDQCAERLEQIKPTSPDHIAKAFDMAGRRKRTAATGSDRLAAAQHVWALQEMRPGVSKEEIFGQVAEQIGKSESYVRDAYYEFSRKLA